MILAAGNDRGCPVGLTHYGNSTHETGIQGRRGRFVPSGEQLRAGLGEPHVSAAFMHDQPAALDRELEAGAIFRGRRLMLEQHRAIEQLDMDATILHGFDRIGDLDQLAGGGFGVRVGTSSGEFHGKIEIRL